MSAPRPRGPSPIHIVFLVAFTLASLSRPAAAQSSGGFLEPALTNVVRPILTGASVGLPARGPFTFPPPYSTRGIRLTNPVDCGGGDCVRFAAYSYWRNMNNHVGSSEILIFLSLDPNAGGTGPTLFSYNKSTGATTNRGALFSASSPLYRASGEGWYFSATIPTALYLNDGPRLLRYDVLAKTTGMVVDVTQFAGPNRSIWQVHSSNDDAVHSFTVKDASTYADLGCGVYLERLGHYRFFPKRGYFDECQIDKSGRFLVIKENADGVNAEDNVVKDLQSGEEWTLADEQGALGHSDLGHGYGVGEDNWNAAPGAIRVWQYGGGIGNGALVWQATSWSHPGGHIAHANANPNAPLGQQVACTSNATSQTLTHANEILCFRLDGSMQTLVVAPVMTDMNTSGGGDSYSKQPKGNLDVTGEYFLWTSNMGTSRLDAFIVRVPLSQLGVSTNLTAQVAGASSSYTLTITRPSGGTILGQDIWCGSAGTTCQVTKPAGAVIALTALAEGGSLLSSWGGCSASFTLNANVSCAPTFAGGGGGVASASGGGGASSYTLTISRPSGGMILGPDIWCGDAGSLCQTTRAAGTVINLTPLPAAGGTLSTWGGCGASLVLSTNISCSPAFTGATSSTSGAGTSTTTSATSPGLSLTLVNPLLGGGGGYILGPELFCPPGGGSLCSRTFSAPASITLTPVAYSGFRFSGWLEAGCTTTMTINSSRICTASFSRLP